MRRITKIFNTKAVSVDDANKTIRFKISDNQPDRMGEIVDQQTWDFKSYLKNPIVLWNHRGQDAEPEDILGNALSLDIEGDGTYATTRLDEDINPKANLVWKQLLRGTLRTVSVGFINHSEEMLDDKPVLKDNELLELSIVPIPANPRAIALSLKEGAISTKDAKWLMEGMRKEADLLEAQLKESTNDMGDKSVDEVKSQIATLTEAVGKLTESNAKLQEQVAEVLKPKDPPEEPKETDEEKKAREEKEAADKKAAEEAEAAKAKEEEEGKTPPAKDGDNDQSGAEDEFDPNAELTPELQAEIDEALEKVEVPTT